MIFNSIEEIVSEIKKVQAVPAWVNDARVYSKDMRALVYGDGFKDLVIQVEHVETAKKALARKKYSRPIKDAISKILEPVNNVYSATGGAKEYNIANDTKRREFLKHIGNVRDGKSLEQWLQSYWSRDLYNIDPSGIMMLEWKDNNAYITYKSIDSIRYYKARGMNIDFVIFEPISTQDNKRVWRIVDDAKDYTIIENGGTFSEDPGKTEPHKFGKCPARIVSDKMHLGKDYRLAFIDAVVEALKEMLRDRSILSIYKFKNGFATHFRPKILCPECHGTGKSGVDQCKSCDAKGYILDKDVTDEIIIPIDLTSENPVQLPSTFAGYISPSLEIWDQYVKEEKRLVNDAFEVVWGTRESEQVKDQTAMGVILNTQPMVTKLNLISDVAQSHEQAFTEMLANFYLTKKHDERISNVSYGRNYIIQPPEFLLSEYQKSNESADPVTIRDRKLSEYLTSKHKNDPETLRVELLKKDLEPYVHYDINTVNSIFGNIEARKKGLFTDWWETLNEADKIKTKEQLESMRDAWYNSNNLITNNQN